MSRLRGEEASSLRAFRRRHWHDKFLVSVHLSRLHRGQRHRRVVLVHHSGFHGCGSVNRCRSCGIRNELHVSVQLHVRRRVGLLHQLRVACALVERLHALRRLLQQCCSRLLLGSALQRSKDRRGNQRGRMQRRPGSAVRRSKQGLPGEPTREKRRAAAAFGYLQSAPIAKPAFANFAKKLISDWLFCGENNRIVGGFTTSKAVPHIQNVIFLYVAPLLRLAD